MKMIIMVGMKDADGEFEEILQRRHLLNRSFGQPSEGSEDSMPDTLNRLKVNVRRGQLPQVVPRVNQPLQVRQARRQLQKRVKDLGKFLSKRLRVN